jgi:hypothetical protein
MSALSFSGGMPFSEIRRTDPGLEIHPSETLDGGRWRSWGSRYAASVSRSPGDE